MAARTLTGQAMARLASLLNWPSNGSQDMAGLASLVHWKSDGSQDMAGLASLVYWKSDGSQDMAGLASLVYWKSDGSQDMAGLASLVYWPMWTVSTESHQKVLLSHGLLAHWTQVYRRLDTCLRSSNRQGSSREKNKEAKHICQCQGRVSDYHNYQSKMPSEKFAVSYALFDISPPVSHSIHTVWGKIQSSIWQAK